MLKAACLAGDVGAVRLLLDSSSSSSSSCAVDDVNEVDDDDGDSPLIAANLGGHLAVARILLSRGYCSRRRQPDKHERVLGSLRGIAAASKWLPCCSRRAASTSTAPRTMVPRRSARGLPQSRPPIATFGADANKAVGEGTSPLWLASVKGHVDVVRLLLANGADVKHAIDDDGLSSLHLASRYGRAEVV
ncbi:hypothetical protein CTAYLR_004040 [Chrysophaeum taylorii]|uniref:Ankyrin repeat protein n=1 Tax=Chrysophaeum taylorii TaxID=2483200 RepID=A0AAD7XFN4_9STRA|nr:hypothetical protein CTAYLR_004040 [Chrysophaeum taylorii]